MTEYLFLVWQPVSELLESGGQILYVILVATFLMWFLMVECYWNLLLRTKVNSDKKDTRAAFKNAAALPVWLKAVMQRGETLRFEQCIIGRISFIKALVSISMLLGLLGTITGMIQLFEGMALLEGNMRILASSVSHTVIPAMAGLVSSISGFYFLSQLQQYAHKKHHIK